MAGVSILMGFPSFQQGHLPPNKVIRHRPSSLAKGLSVCVLLPDLLELPEDLGVEDFSDGLPLEESSPVVSGMFHAMTVSILPELPQDFSHFSSVAEVVWQDSFTNLRGCARRAEN